MQQREQYVRPSADVLFVSAVEQCGSRMIAVILSGKGQDGTRGMRAVHLRGGTTIAQDRGTSEFFSMPGTAIQAGVVDYVVPLDEIALRLMALIRPVSPMPLAV